MQIVKLLVLFQKFDHYGDILPHNGNYTTVIGDCGNGSNLWSFADDSSHK